MAEQFEDIRACSRQEVAEFQEGELSPPDEARVQAHINGCKSCAEYLNSVKMVSTSLEILLDKEPIKIPSAFSKTVKTAAESDTGGIRSPKERYRAIAVSAVLLSLAALFLSTNASAMAPAFNEFSSGVSAVGGFLGQFIYAISLAFAFGASAVCSNLLFNSAVTALAVLLILTISLYVFSKHITHSNR